MVHGSLDGSKGMLDNLFALAHDLWMVTHPFGHRIQQMLMLPARNAPSFFGTARTLHSDRTATAGRRGVIPCGPSILDGGEAIGEYCPSGTTIGIVFSVIHKVGFGKEASFLIARRLRLGNIWGNVRVQASFDFFSVVLADVSNKLQCLHAQHLFGTQRHQRQLVLVRHRIAHVVLHNQFMLIIHRDLDVIADLGALGYWH